jgi:hypothetical protein
MTENEKTEYWTKLASEIDLIRPDLQNLGFKRDNILILRDYPDYSAAIDVIFEHIKKPYLDRVQETLGQLLAHPSAFSRWGELLTIYQNADKCSSPGLMDGIAIALCEHLKRSKSTELENEINKLLRDRSRGQSRILFLSCFRRKRDEDSMNLIVELSTAQDLKTEIASWKRKTR